MWTKGTVHTYEQYPLVTVASALVAARCPIYIDPSFIFRVESVLQVSFNHNRTVAQRCPRVLSTPPSNDIKFAHLKFLFIHRLRIRIDICDRADLATYGVGLVIALAIRVCSS
jgi:hypothetical protein